MNTLQQRINQLTLPVAILFLTGCLGDKFTPSEHALVNNEGSRICFTVNKPGDYYVSYFYLFERGYENSALQPVVVNYRANNSLHLCLPEGAVRNSDTVYVAQFGLKTQTRRKPIRNFSVAFKTYNAGVISVPLQRNEITYYIGRGY
ncbi:putative T6SS immunity periplasmic lipoprotein [Leclercia sp.]|uniref:putative T6SS immunity periplasmic lipoprotein n=1 Tax=Leclercia sp. TaxID=1898428 RepID=UPI00391CAB9B